MATKIPKKGWPQQHKIAPKRNAKQLLKNALSLSLFFFIITLF